jgi:hypothetical protein
MTTTKKTDNTHSAKSGDTKRGHRAAQAATAKNTLHVQLPILGAVTLPPPEQLTYIGGIAALAALEIIEWPVGLALATGYLLAATHGNKTLRDFGDALEQA